MTKGVTFWLLNPWFKEYFRQFLFISLYNADVITYLITFISFSKNLWYLVYYVSECLYLVTLITWSWWKSIMWKTDVTSGKVSSLLQNIIPKSYSWFWIEPGKFQPMNEDNSWVRFLPTKKIELKIRWDTIKKHLEDGEGHMYMIK